MHSAMMLRGALAFDLGLAMIPAREDCARRLANGADPRRVRPSLARPDRQTLKALLRDARERHVDITGLSHFNRLHGDTECSRGDFCVLVEGLEAGIEGSQITARRVSFGTACLSSST